MPYGFQSPLETLFHTQFQEWTILPNWVVLAAEPTRKENTVGYWIVIPTHLLFCTKVCTVLLLPEIL